MGNHGSVCDNSDSPALGSSSSEQNYPQNSEGDDCKELNDKLPAEFSSKYQAVSKIGSGSFGNVYKVRDNKTKAIYVAKLVDLQHHHSPLEVQIQTTIDNKHVVKIYDTISIQEGKKLFIVMEYCEGGNLLQWIKRNRKHKLLNEKVILQMLQELCDAVYSCHQKRVIHRDLKPENILLDGKRRVKLADFGVARILDKKSYATSFCGTPPYMAPELFLSYLSKSGQSGVVGYDAKCDVWSIGCILWDMANTANMFTFELSNHVGLNVAQATSESLGAREIQDLIEKKVPQDYRITKRLLHSMLKKNPDERATLSEILQDRELREALENPMDSHWSDML